MTMDSWRGDLELKGFAHEEVTLKWILVVHDDVVGL